MEKVQIPGYRIPEYFSMIVAGRRTIMWSVFVALVLGLLVLRTMSPSFAVEMIIGESEFESLTGHVSEGPEQGVSELLGLTAPGSSKYIQFVSAVHTPRLAERLAEHPEIMRGVFRAEWNGSAWQEPRRSLLGTISNVVRFLAGQPPRKWHPPSPARLSDWLKSNIQVERDKETSMVTISLQTKDPKFGVSLLNAVYSETDGLFRAEMLEQYTTLRDYTVGKLANATLDAHRQALTILLTSTERRQITLASGLPYAASLFQPPVASGSPTFPRIGIVLALAIIVGLIVGTIFVLLRK